MAESSQDGHDSLELLVPPIFRWGCIQRDDRMPILRAGCPRHHTGYTPNIHRINDKCVLLEEAGSRVGDVPSMERRVRSPTSNQPIRVVARRCARKTESPDPLDQQDTEVLHYTEKRCFSQEPL